MLNFTQCQWYVSKNRLIDEVSQIFYSWIQHFKTFSTKLCYFFEGVKVIGVETVKFEYNKGSRSQPINDEKSDYTVESNRGHHWIIGLR